MTAPPPPQAPPVGGPTPPAVIHDIRYSRFSGDLRPRVFAVLALARSSALRALGIRRSAGAKVWPFLLIAAAYIPAIVAVGVPVVLGDALGDDVLGPLDVIDYPTMLTITSILVLAYAATTVPSLLTRDRRDRVLSLYFSTALSPGEYIVGKVLAGVGLVLLVTLGPLLVLLIGGIVIADSPLDYATDHAGDWGKVIAASLIVAVLQAAVALALGSLTPRRVFAVGGYIALMLVPAALAGILQGISGKDEFAAFNLVQVPIALGRRLFLDGDSSPSVGVLLTSWTITVLLGLGTLVFRYTKGARS